MVVGIDVGGLQQQQPRLVELGAQVALHMALDGQRQRAAGLQVQRPVGELDGLAELGRRVRAAALHHIQDVPLGQPGPWRGHALVSLAYRLQQLTAAVQIARGGAVHQADAAHQRGVAVQLWQGQHPRSLHRGADQRLAAGVGQAQNELAVHLQQVVQLAAQAVGPDHLAALHVGQFGLYDHPFTHHRKAAAERIRGRQVGAHVVQTQCPAFEGGCGHARDHPQLGVARQMGDDPVGNQLAHHLVLGRGLAAVKRNNGNTGPQVGLFGRGRWAARCVAGAHRPHLPGAHRLGPVFEVRFAHVLDVGVHAIHDAVAHRAGDHGLARVGQTRHTGGQVDALAVDVQVVGVNVAGVEPGAQPYLVLWVSAGVDFGGVAVQRKGRLQGQLRLVEFGHETVAQAFDEPPGAARQHLVAHVPCEVVPLRHGVGFVAVHEAHGLDQIDDKDGFVECQRPGGWVRPHPIRWGWATVIGVGLVCHTSYCVCRTVINHAIAIGMGMFVILWVTKKPIRDRLFGGLPHRSAAFQHRLTSAGR